MGILSSLKKLLFASESLAKSGADKAANAAKSTASDIADKGEALANQAKDVIVDKTSGLRDALETGAEQFTEKAGDVFDNLKDKGTDILDTIKPTNIEKEFTDIGDKPEAVQTGNVIDDTVSALRDKTQDIKNTINESQTVQEIKDKVKGKYDDLAENEAIQKIGEISENVGSKVIETTQAAAGTVAGVGSSIYDNTKDAAKEATDKVFEKAGEIKEEFEERYDNTYEAALQDEAREAAENKGKFAEDTLDASGSLLEGQDDFFSKAAKYADGNYGAMSEGKIELLDTKSNSEQHPPAKAAGFVDHDGDGNELIDDADIVEE